MSTLQYDAEKLDTLVEELHQGLLDEGLTTENSIDNISELDSAVYEKEDQSLEINYLRRAGSVAAINSYQGDALETVDDVLERSDNLERVRKGIQQAI